MPDWLNNSEIYELREAKRTKLTISEKNKQISKMGKEILELEEIVKEQSILHGLLYETGKPLENAVTKALILLGYSAEKFDNGTLELDQIIISPEGDRYIGECEGKDNKDIDISKIRQLSDSLNEDLSSDEVEDKAFGLLIGNPQRLTEPVKRTLDFTEKCLRSAKREQIGLIKTIDLFAVSRYLLENDDDRFKTACRQAIRSQLGSVVKFPLLPNISNSPSAKDSEK